MPASSESSSTTDSPAHGPPTGTPPTSTLGERFRAAAGNLRFDLPASLVVFLVAVPLSLGIAVASNAPIAAGLIAAVVGGVVAGLFGGSPLQVSGPAAGLTVIVAGLVEQFGWQVTCAITVLAGLCQVVLGLSRIARMVLAVSPAIVHGMLAGIGITIALGQLHVLLGGQAGTHAIENIIQLPAQLLDLHDHAAFIGLLVIALLLIWPRLPKPIRVVPGPLVAVTAATLVAMFWAADAPRVELPGSVLDAVQLPSLPDGQWAAFVVGVVTVTAIASIESLLSASAVDKLAADKRSDVSRTKLDRELVGQGLANSTSGLLGGLPVTGVIVRSSSNVAAGARSRTSAVLHGVWVAVFALLLVSLVERIPMAALAGLLVVVGGQLVKVAHIRTVRRHGELPVYLVTVVGVVALNLLEGVLVGLALALVLMIGRVARAKVHAERATAADSTGVERWTVTAEGTLCFLSIPRLSKVLGRVPAGARVELELVADFLDHAAFEYLNGWVQQHEAAGGAVLVDEIGVASLRGNGDRRARRTGAAALPRFFSPWSVWQARRSGVAIPTQRAEDAAIDPFVTGVREYHRRSAPLLQEVYAELSTVHEPKALFLTCADARIVPNVITASGPGDLFTVRNIGNLVPPEDAADPESDSSVAASVEFAVESLAVPAALVCGHSSCGAMNGLLTGAADGSGMLGRWLRAGVPSLEAWRSGHPVGVAAADEGRREVDQLAMVNVALQVQALRAKPTVRRAVEAGRLGVTGVFFDISTGGVLILDEGAGRFRPVAPDDGDPDMLADLRGTG